MKTFEIKEHPFKVTLEVDDDFLKGIEEVSDKDMEDMVEAARESLHDVAVELYRLKAQKEASEKM